LDTLHPIASPDTTSGDGIEAPPTAGSSPSPLSIGSSIVDAVGKFVRRVFRYVTVPDLLAMPADSAEDLLIELSAPTKTALQAMLTIEWLQAAYRALKPGGVLALNVPRWFGKMARKLGLQVFVMVPGDCTPKQPGRRRQPVGNPGASARRLPRKPLVRNDTTTLYFAKTPRPLDMPEPLPPVRDVEHVRTLLVCLGGKAPGAKEWLPYYPTTSVFVDVMCGGLGISRHIAARSPTTRIFAYDGDAARINCYQCVQADATRVQRHLYPLLAAFTPLSPHGRRDFFEDQRARYLDGPGIDDPDERAAVYFMLNRLSWSGTTFTGGSRWGDVHTRFNPSTVRRLAEIDLRRFTFAAQDFRDTILQWRGHRSAHMAIDPPYISGDQFLYQRPGILPWTACDHLDLRDLLSGCRNWTLHYDLSDEVMSLWCGYPMVKMDWKYSLSGVMQPSNEVIILPHSTAS
jgi:site-specific DNA-adenine methylase